ncbi:MAG: recombinase [Spirochaetia bacterium]|jgi:site-specific recombinase XerD
MSAKEYEEYEQACAAIREENAKLLSAFRQWLGQSGISEKTIDRHASNADFYINEFLLYEDAVPAEDGADQISMFLGYWFIRKAMWASTSAIKQNAVSLAKFYAFMLEKGLIDSEDLQHLERTIKNRMPEWLATMKRYDDPDITDPDEIWGL